ncbi:MAG: hypothetical protein HYY06_17955 [Deltaproteobacteria bacterium]|nr:hypothetical protein [Deltaproteobacteria bacterium]
MRVAAAVVALALAACAPHFRADENRARRAMDADELQDLLDAASEAVAAGDHARAVDAYLEAIEVNPRFPASVYLALARELVDAGDPARALAVARFAVAPNAGRSSEIGALAGPLRELAARFAAADLPALAIDVLAEQPGGLTDPAAVAGIPGLDRLLGRLVSAREHAMGGRPEEAVRAYREWLSEYGVADHSVLRCWSAEALGGQSTATQALLASARRSAAGGDLALAAQRYGLLLSYEPQSEPSQSEGLVDAGQRAGALLRLGPQAARRVADATAAAEQHRLGPAIHAYRLAVLEAPWHPELRRNLGTLLAAAGLHGEAARQGEWLVAFRPEDAGARESVAAWRRQSVARTGAAGEYACGVPGAQESVDLTLSAAFTPSPRVARGQSGGPSEASALGAGCRGWIKGRPDHVVRLETSFAALRMDVTAPGDTTLVVQTPSGQWLCSDDVVGNNPRVEGALGAGSYRIWVGSYRPGQSFAYELSLAESGPSTSPAPRSVEPPAQPPPSGTALVMGTIALGQTAQGSTSGAPHALRPSCVPSSTAGEHVWRFTPSATGSYRVAVSAEYDSALAVLDGASEVACNDDSGGARASEVIVTLTAGRTYDVVVDGYAQATGAYRLTIAEGAATTPATPAPNAGDASRIAERCQAAPLLAGGHRSDTLDANVASFATSCGGGGAGGDVVYRIDVPQPSTVTVSEVSEFDAVLELRGSCTAAVVACVDDAPDRRHTAVTAQVGAGTYYLIVDTFSAGMAGPFTLDVAVTPAQ